MFNKYILILKREIESRVSSNLEEYTMDSTIGRDIGDFYKSIVSRVLGVRVWVCIYEISDGKYQVDFHFENSLILSLFSNASHTPEIIQENILESVVKPYMETMKKGSEGNGESK